MLLTLTMMVTVISSTREKPTTMKMVLGDGMKTTERETLLHTGLSHGI